MLFNYLLGKLAEEKFPRIDKKRCIHYRNGKDGCGKCKEACPTQSILLVGGKVKVNEGTCIQCGTCKGICPTEAVTFDGFGEEHILRKMKEKEHLLFSCGKMDGMGTLKINCLNGFRGEMLAALLIFLKDEKIYFNLSHCKECEVNKGCEGFLASLNQAKLLLDQLEVPYEVQLLYSEEGAEHLVAETLSRRELLTLLKKESSFWAAQTTHNLLKGKKGEVSSRKILLEALKLVKLDHSKALVDTPFFVTWDVKDSCNGCDFCQAICPSGAWKIKKEENRHLLQHHSGRCTACGLCIHLCPQKAIEKGSFSLKLLDGFINKKEKPLLICKECGRKFVARDQEKSLCITCEKRQSLRVMLKG